MSDSSARSIAFTSDLQEVIAQEQAYIQQRRQTLGLPEDGPTWGLALSGGGIRSASLSLGMVQKLIVEGYLEKFDYLSSVSGGGYLGSCLSSLMNEDPEVFVHPSYLPSTSSVPGLDSDTSPLAMLMDRVEAPTSTESTRGAFLPSDLNSQVELPPDLETKPAEKTRLNAKIQLEHLQRHSEYLSVDSSFTSPDFLRLVGTLISGSLYTILIFLLALLGIVAFFQFILELASSGQFFDGLKGGPAADMGGFGQAWGVFFTHIGEAIVFHPPSSLLAVLIGMGVSASFLIGGVLTIRKGGKSPLLAVSSDRNAEQTYLQKRVDRFFLVNLLVIPVIWIGWILAKSFGWVPEAAYSVIWILPLLYSLGTFVACLILVPFIGWKERNTRSLSQALLGSTVYLLFTNLLIPLLLGAAFLVGYYFDVLLSTGLAALSSVGATALGYLASSMSASGKEESKQPTFVASLMPVLLNLLVFIAIFLATVIMVRLLAAWPDQTWIGAWFALGAGLLLLVLGFLLNANRISLHNFYRDRLSEAFLQTDAPVKPEIEETPGFPLQTLRDQSQIQLQDLIKSGKAPYHLIQATLNRPGSTQYNRKDLYSEHFLLSPMFIGAHSTGYAATKAYQEGKTTLSQAMALSAAAANSGMGFYGSLGQSFLMTLLNLRIGQWLPNPRIYAPGKKALSGTKRPFWPWYLLLEMFGLADAQSSMINLSDGGHNGDNLGLLPLIQRRCKVIVVADFEEDGEFKFGSLAHVVRMARLEAYTTVQIDLEPLLPKTNDQGNQEAGPQGVVIGHLGYPDGSRGTLVYVKSSLSEAKAPLPLNTKVYQLAHLDFPHQSTGDQFFDAPQYDAYTALGFHLGGELVDALRQV